MKKKNCINNRWSRIYWKSSRGSSSKKGFQVRVIDNLSGGRLENIKHHKKNKNLIFKKLDINKISNNEKIFKNVNYVFHLAGKGDIVPSIENPASYMLTNVIGTTNVLENCRNKK